MPTLFGYIPLILGCLGILLSFILLTILVFRYNLLETIFKAPNAVYIKIALLFALINTIAQAFFFNERLVIFLATREYQDFPNIPTMGTSFFISGIASLAFFVFFYAFIDRFVPFLAAVIRESDAMERMYFCCMGIIAAVAVFFIFGITEEFYLPKNIDGKLVRFDVVYITDSGELVSSDVYANVVARENNDIRQSLFAVFAMPFAAFAKFISLFLFFVPHSYVIVINIIQVLLLLLCIVLIGRMLQLKSTEKIFFFSISTVSFPVLLFSLAMEQYIFSLFWLILLLYSSLFQKTNNLDWLFVGAAGSLITNAFFFPLALDSPTLIGKVKGVLNLVGKFLCLSLLFGRLPLLLDTLNGLFRLMRFTGIKIPISERFFQFTEFVCSCFTIPSSCSELFECQLTSTVFMAYHQQPVTSINYLGCAILLVALLGFALNHKEVFARVCFSWVAFSFLILCVIGWGTAENGLVLYTLYFSWAYLALIFLAIEKAFQKWKPIRYTIYSTAIVILAIINFAGIYDIIQFGITYYPAR